MERRELENKGKSWERGRKGESLRSIEFPLFLLVPFQASFPPRSTQLFGHQGPLFCTQMKKSKTQSKLAGRPAKVIALSSPEEKNRRKGEHKAQKCVFALVCECVRCTHKGDHMHAQYQEWYLLLLTLLNHSQCYFLCVYKTVNQISFRGMERPCQGKNPLMERRVKAEDRSILKLNYPLSWPDYKILPTCPSEFWLGNLEALGIHYDLTMNNRCTVY